MELHAVHGASRWRRPMMMPLSVVEVVSMTSGMVSGYDRQGVVAGRGEGAGHILEHGDVLVHEAGGLAVHEFGGVGDGAAECFRDGLVAEAYAQQRLLRFGCPADGVDDDAGFCGGAGAWGDKYAVVFFSELDARSSSSYSSLRMTVVSAPSCWM